jgi:hypothetical protein
MKVCLTFWSFYKEENWISYALLEFQSSLQWFKRWTLNVFVFMLFNCLFVSILKESKKDKSHEMFRSVWYYKILSHTSNFVIGQNDENYSLFHFHSLYVLLILQLSFFFSHILLNYLLFNEYVAHREQWR